MSDEQTAVQPAVAVLDLQTRQDTLALDDVHFYFNADGDFCEKNDPDRKIDVVFWLRELDGHDNEACVKYLAKRDKRGREVRDLYGHSRERCVRAVVRIDNLAMGGQPVAKLTPDVFDALPSRMQNSLVNKINEREGVEETALGE